MGLPIYGDPDALDRLAGRLVARAAEVRERANDHVRQGQAARWVSAAAQAYRDRIAADRAEADRAAAELERAAAVLRAHAQQIRETVALIAKYERAATAWFDHQVASFAHKVEHVVDTAERVVKTLAHDPPWRTWPIGPDNLPASGDMKWLDVGGFLSKQGVL